MKKLLLATMVMSVSGLVMADDAVMTDNYNAPNECSIQIDNSVDNANAFGDEFVLTLNKLATITSSTPVVTGSDASDVQVVTSDDAAIPSEAVQNLTLKFISPTIDKLNSGEQVVVTSTITAACHS